MKHEGLIRVTVLHCLIHVLKWSSYVFNMYWNEEVLMSLITVKIVGMWIGFSLKNEFIFKIGRGQRTLSMVAEDEEKRRLSVTFYWTLSLLHVWQVPLSPKTFRLVGKQMFETHLMKVMYRLSNTLKEIHQSSLEVSILYYTSIVNILWTCGKLILSNTCLHFIPFHALVCCIFSVKVKFLIVWP